MLAGVDETEGGFWEGGTEGKERGEIVYAQVGGDGDRYCCVMR